MRTFDVLVPCHFVLEAVLKREIYDLGYEITKVEDGRVMRRQSAVPIFSCARQNV